MEVGLAHQLGVIWPGEFDFEVISQFWSDARALWHSHGGHKGWISGSLVLHGINAQYCVIYGSKHGAWGFEARKAIVKVQNWHHMPELIQ